MDLWNDTATVGNRIEVSKDIKIELPYNLQLHFWGFIQKNWNQALRWDHCRTSSHNIQDLKTSPCSSLQQNA